MPLPTVQEILLFRLYDAARNKAENKTVDKYISMLGLEDFKHAIPANFWAWPMNVPDEPYAYLN